MKTSTATPTTSTARNPRPRCACGKAMSKSAHECNACYAKRNEARAAEAQASGRSRAMPKTTITLRASARYGYGGKQYLAQINGRDPKFTFDRMFIGKKGGKRGEDSEAMVDAPGLFEERDIDSKGRATDTYRVVFYDRDGDIDSNVISKERAMKLAKNPAVAELHLAGYEAEIARREAVLHNDGAKDQTEEVTWGSDFGGLTAGKYPRARILEAHRVEIEVLRAIVASGTIANAGEGVSLPVDIDAAIKAATPPPAEDAVSRAVKVEGRFLICTASQYAEKGEEERSLYSFIAARPDDGDTYDVVKNTHNGTLPTGLPREDLHVLMDHLGAAHPPHGQPPLRPRERAELVREREALAASLDAIQKRLADVDARLAAPGAEA